MISKRLGKYIAIGLVNIILFSLLLRWLYLNINLKLVTYEMSQLSSWSILFSGALGISLYWFYGLRMATLLDRKVLPSSQIVILGFGFNAFLPFRLGELLKYYFARQLFKVDLTKIAFASVVEKILDVIVLASLGALFIFQKVNSFFAGFALIVFLLLIGFRIKPYLFKMPLFSKPSIQKLLKSLSEVIAMSKLGRLVASTLIIWAFTCFIFVIFFSMNLGFGNFGLLDALNLLLITTLSLSIPSMPASLGLFESGIVYYLTQHLHLAADQAVAYAVVYHLIMIIPHMLLTLVILLANMKRLPKMEPSYT